LVIRVEIPLPAVGEALVYRFVAGEVEIRDYGVVVAGGED